MGTAEGEEYEKSKKESSGFPGGAVVESPPADAGDKGLCPGPGRSHMPRSLSLIHISEPTRPY